MGFVVCLFMFFVYRVFILNIFVGLAAVLGTPVVLLRWDKRSRFLVLSIYLSLFICVCIGRKNARSGSLATWKLKFPPEYFCAAEGGANFFQDSKGLFQKTGYLKIFIISTYVLKVASACLLLGLKPRGLGLRVSNECWTYLVTKHLFWSVFWPCFRAILMWRIRQFLNFFSFFYTLTLLKYTKMIVSYQLGTVVLDNATVAKRW